MRLAGDSHNPTKASSIAISHKNIGRDRERREQEDLQG